MYSQLVQHCLSEYGGIINQFDWLLFEYSLKLDWCPNLRWIHVHLFAFITKKPIQSWLLPEGQKYGGVQCLMNGSLQSENGSPSPDESAVSATIHWAAS